MKRTRMKSAAVAALALALAIALTSCGVVGDYALRTYFSSNGAYDSDAATDTQAQTAQSEPPFLAPVIADDGEENGGIRPPDVTGEVSTPLMWRATDEKTGAQIYLLGSMHAGLEDMCLFPGEIYDAFDECTALAVESDVIESEKDASAGVEGLRMLVYRDGTTTSDHIDADVYASAVKILEDNGYPREYMNAYVPILWQQVIEEILTEQTPYKYDNGVDRYFLREAKRLGKEVLEIEQPLDTYRGLASLSESTQKILLADEVEASYVSSFGDDMAALYEMWKRGDADEISEALLGSGEESAAGTQSAESDSETDGDGEKDSDKESEKVDERAAAYDEYDKMMLDDRNRVMINKAREYLKRRKKVFYVVGLAHMLGDGGIVEGLRDLGFTVEQMEYASQNAN